MFKMQDLQAINREVLPEVFQRTEYLLKSLSAICYVQIVTEKQNIQNEEIMCKKIMYWGYLHQNGNIIVKRWFGDHKDYTVDCDGNDFVQKVMPPFEAISREQADEMAEKWLT